MADDALSIVQRLSRVFDELGIAYLVGGSIASIRYGELRATNDVDFVAELQLQHADQIAAKLEGSWYAERDAIADAIRRSSSFNLIDFETMLKADVFVSNRDDFTRQQFARKRLESLGPPDDPIDAYLASPEDIILQKIRWYRMGGEISDRQWRDIKGVLIYQAGKLDEGYLDHWAAELRITDLLTRARKDSERLSKPK
jgi:hypothetical protein